ncbi:MULTISPECIES: helix-turn-helix transcriptional regulator [unclassified Agrobacterium]|uniref:LexA family transcriptional regulator n=1 Tax=unclassified Agrobacterium TaxID=2632611 RepID=UPI0022CB3DE3|nr:MULTISPECIES: helix-turn-helix transcriptional regulator [unclassified Agrobacterium]MCZ7499334.1 helix-turn-helix transcriptional regulator [Rhizobium rhizogenes]MDH0613609.1 helix-turn-helix transcriptional regulator [Agrobacterium sp. GD03872]MDH0696498.1 helix-turn-helix transcriptional regulator [Agrobacterium sp. GD03871]MDH1059810.1 helix-turn-helix transcriptional regulator [Agrobacterium sp. GD03992]MDH2210253.1 helix-turn-helix transcriptional regulator [Agrobacterium sp. GD03643]
MLTKPIKSGNDVSTFDNAATRERLSVVIDRIGSLVKAGEIAGVSDEQIARWRDGKAKPNFYGIAMLTYAAGKSLDWLITGEEAPELPTEAQGGVIIQTGDLPGFTLIPRLGVHASAGNGTIAVTEEPVDFLAFQESWLRSRKINPKYARVLTTRGDSMEPTIRDGDILLVDTSIDRIKDNAIYVIVYGEMVLVKRVHGRMNGSLQIISDNPLYPPEEIAPGEVDLLNIAGRVMWFGRST